QIFVANGSNEGLQALMLAYGGHGRTALTFEPTYALHGHISRITGTSVLHQPRDADFAIDPVSATKFIEAEQPDVVFLCSPNNPTGLAEPPDLIRAVVAAAPGIVVVDEAYGQFAEFSAATLLAENIPLVVARTFSKTWAMAAARLGYLIAPSWLVAELEKVILPYHLDALSQVAGQIALRFDAEMHERVALLTSERERISAAIAGLGCEVWPSEANFVLFRPGEADSDAIWQSLVDQSVLVRNCSSWPSLDGCLRVTVGTAQENDRFLEALDTALSTQGGGRG
ncbi:MAG: aminotransferase class I/II-fold pyridoxal phosphate-dependent enzyme, partial [Acidimicrobiales bacterium]